MDSVFLALLHAGLVEYAPCIHDHGRGDADEESLREQQTDEQNEHDQPPRTATTEHEIARCDQSAVRSLASVRYEREICACNSEIEDRRHEQHRLDVLGHDGDTERDRDE